MAGITRVHPVATPTLPVSMGGSTENMTYVEVDYGADVSGKTGPESTLAQVASLMGTFGTVVYQGPLFDSNTRQHIGIEGCTTDNMGTIKNKKLIPAEKGIPKWAKAAAGFAAGYAIGKTSFTG